MKNFIIKIYLFLFIIVSCSCSSVVKNSSKMHALTIARQLEINENDVKEGKSCRYLGFIGSGEEKQALDNGNIKTKIYSQEDDDTIMHCNYAYGI